MTHGQRGLNALPMRKTPITRRFRFEMPDEELRRHESAQACGLSLLELQGDRECIVSELESFGMVTQWEQTVRAVVADPIGERERRIVETRAALEARVEAHNQRAIENGKRGVLTVTDWMIVCSLFAHRCAYCWRQGTPFSLCIEHFVPISKGGDTSPGNIVPACGSCNAKKHTKEPMDFIDSLPNRVDVYSRISTAQKRLGL